MERQPVGSWDGPVIVAPESKNEITKNRKRIYEGRILNLRVDDVEFPSGKTGCREVVEHRPAVGILAENDRGEFLLVRQYRYAAGVTLLEIPAGIVEEGEDYDATVIRELQEETGYRPGKLREIARIFTSPGFSNELLILYYATDLTLSKLPEDEDEFLEVVPVNRKQLFRLYLSGDMQDAKTLCAFCWYFSHLNI